MPAVCVTIPHLILSFSNLQGVDEDDDGHISFREFLLIFRKSAAGELSADSGLSVLAKEVEVNVEEVGVGGAKDFFEAKVRGDFALSYLGKCV